MDVIAKRRILWDEPEEAAPGPQNQSGTPDSPPQPDPQNQSGTPDSPPPAQPATQIAVEVKTPRNGNGHKSEKIRSLNDVEKDILRDAFVSHDGRFLYKDCTTDLMPLMGSDITVWQVSGFLSQIHVEVYKGLIQLQNPEEYFQFMAEKYPKKHARYMAKYGPQTTTSTPAPKFAQGVPAGKLR